MKTIFTVVMIICLIASVGLTADKEKIKKADAAPKAEVEKAAIDTEDTKPPPTRAFSNGLKIGWQAVSGGGMMRGSSENFDLNATSGQPTSGDCESDNYGSNSGFWQEIIAGSCCDLGGDANNDGSVNVGDPVYLVNYIFKYGPEPACFDAADANNDCAVNVGDPVYLINYVFKYGPAPTCGCVD